MKHPHSKFRSAMSFLLFFVVILVATNTWTHISRDRWDTPPLPFNIDGVFYDSIGFNLSLGNGFSVDFTNDEWKQVYRNCNREGRYQQKYDWIMRQHDRGPTAMRSPGYPLFLAGVFRTFGRSWDAARMAGSVLVSLGLALQLAWCRQQFGWWTSLLACATIFVDYSIMNTAGLIASEPLAILVVGAFMVAAIHAYQSPTFLKFSIAGILFAATMLTRGNWNLAFLLMTVASLLLVSAQVRKRIHPVSPAHLFTFWVVCAVLVMPWWIRNCQVTGHFQPFGTAGSNGLVGAYCDESFNDFGNWQNQLYRQNQIQVLADLDTSQMVLAEREYVTGKASTAKAFAWAGQNWTRLPQLGIYRYLSHWGFTNRTVPWPAKIGNGLLILGGFLGCFMLPARVRSVVGFILLIDALVVMVTWAHVGRYGIPLRPLLHIGFATLVITNLRRFVFKGSHSALEPD